MSIFRTIRQIDSQLGLTNTLSNLADQAVDLARNPMRCTGVAGGSLAAGIGVFTLAYGVIVFNPTLQYLGFGISVIGAMVIVKSLDPTADLGLNDSDDESNEELEEQEEPEEQEAPEGQEEHNITSHSPVQI
ncbi:MAG TPA: hypothetical protein VHE99_10800 [Gammaproteobacteria bacterium]|nr:hypothetical protein [Gammaproteobacteria bacterium]